jgi:8-oxo-dGTP diphosphatase
MSAQRAIPAASIVVFRDDDVLVVRRGEKMGGGYWAPPGGKIEPGESAKQAALRELAEETGVEAEIVGECGVYEVKSGERLYSITCFGALWLRGEPEGMSDVAEARFLPSAQILQIPLAPQAFDAIRAGWKVARGQRH